MGVIPIWKTSLKDHKDQFKGLPVEKFKAALTSEIGIEVAVSYTP
jgi:hypothetical protein